METAPSTDEVGDERQWLRVAAATIIGLITIAGVVFALMQAQGWKFG